MPANKLTLHQIEQRLDWVENMIAHERDPKNLPNLNAIYQELIDELVRRDMNTDAGVSKAAR